jgi:hypothetical protein
VVTAAATSKYSSEVPRSTATVDQRNAASVPIETSVSMVAARRRRLSRAARWNGHPAHATTGTVRASASQSSVRSSPWRMAESMRRSWMLNPSRIPIATTIALSGSASSRRRPWSRWCSRRSASASAASAAGSSGSGALAV